MSDFKTSTLLKKLRNNYNYTVQDIADFLGVSKAAVSKWETGEDITTEHLYELSKLYNVTFSELYNGKLNCESNEDCWKRNYDLSNFEFEENINSKNVDKLKDLFDHCNMVKDRFYELLPRWAENKLSNKELEEFKYIKKYFKFDINYYSYKKYGELRSVLAQEKEQKEFTIEILNEINKFDEKSYMWELTKLYDFTYDYKANKIYESKNLKAIEYMFSTLSQIEKDRTLNVNLHITEKVVDDLITKIPRTIVRKRTNEEIEQIPYFKIIISSGAHKLYDIKHSQEIWDEEIFNAIEGSAIEINYNVYDKYQFNIDDRKVNISILNNWKLFSYNEYLDSIDKNGTDQLKDIVNLKESSPLKYYEKMVKRDNANVKR